MVVVLVLVMVFVFVLVGRLWCLCGLVGDQLVGWLACLFAGWLVVLVGWLVGWSVAWWVGWLVG